MNSIQYLSFSGTESAVRSLAPVAPPPVPPPPQPLPVQQDVKDVENLIDQDKEEKENENLANTKEKTPMCLVNELARYNKVRAVARVTVRRSIIVSLYTEFFPFRAVASP